MANESNYTPHAAGVFNIPAGTRMNPIEYIRAEKIMRLQKEAMFSRITKTMGFGTCGQALSIRHEFSPMERAQKTNHGGILKPVDVIVPKEEIFTINDMQGIMLRWTQCNWDKIQAYDPGFINEVITAYQDDTALAYDTRVFTKIISEASPYNRGMNAGRTSRNIKLGTRENPLSTTPDSVWAQHRMISRVLSENSVRGSSTGRPIFAIVPEGFLDYIALSDRLSSYYHRGNCIRCDSTAMSEMHMVDNIEYMVSKCTFRIFDGDDIIAPIMFGYDDAVWSAYDFQMEYKKGGPGDSNQYIEMYWHNGLKVIQPEKLGVMWVRLKPLDTGA